MKAIKAIQPRHYPTFTYKGKPIQMVQSFKYLGNSVPSTNIWKVCYESRLQVGGNSYYMLENQWNQSDIRQWEVKLMLFNVMVVQVLLDRVEVWGDILSLSAWNEIEKNQNLFKKPKYALMSWVGNLYYIWRDDISRILYGLRVSQFVRRKEIQSVKPCLPLLDIDNCFTFEGIMSAVMQCSHVLYCK